MPNPKPTNHAEVALQRVERVLAQPFAIYPGISDAARRVANLSAHGYTNKEIADKLNLSAPTVAYHLRTIRDQLGLSKYEITQAMVRQIRNVLDAYKAVRDQGDPNDAKD